jgi:hypothetical protein
VRKGTSIAWDILYRAVDMAKTGPVDPMIHCDEKKNGRGMMS